MGTFRITACDNKGIESFFMFNTENSELLNLSNGQFVPIPRLIPGEEEANKNFKPVSKYYEIDNHYKYRTDLIGKLKSFDTPYLSDDWGDIRLFIDTFRIGNHFEKTNTRCDTCPFVSLCASKDKHYGCFNIYQHNAALFAVFIERVTHLIPISIESVEYSSFEWEGSKWLLNPFYTNISEIVYLPLELRTPAPIVDEVKLFTWLNDSRKAQHQLLSQIDRTNTIYDSGYDTDSDVAFVNAITDPITGEWFNGFDKEFPELAAFFELYPLTNKRIMTISTTADIELYAKKTNFRFHKDWDTYKIGFRFYAVVDPKPKLLFRKVREEYLNFYKQRISKGQRFNVPQHHTHESFAANLLHGPHAWCLNTLDVSHAAIDVHENRSVFLLYGDIDYRKFDKIVFDSMNKYHGNVLLMSDLDAETNPAKVYPTDLLGI